MAPLRLPILPPNPFIKDEVSVPGTEGTDKIILYKTPACSAGVLMVARTTETWNEIVADLKAWAAFAEDFKHGSLATA